MCLLGRFYNTEQLLTPKSGIRPSGPQGVLVPGGIVRPQHRGANAMCYPDAPCRSSAPGVLLRATSSRSPLITPQFH